MHPHLFQKQQRSLLDDQSAYKKLMLNKKRSVEQDHTAMIDEAAQRFCYDDCKEVYWNPEAFSLLYGTPLWDQASAAQRVVLNHLYWVAYYSQIVSAEIATIFLNQVSAAGLYTMEDFRTVCDLLDHESKQERAHIHAFKTISEEVEWRLFGQRLFTYPMRGLYEHTMIFNDGNWAKNYWRNMQLKAFTLLASNKAFLASQYLLIRGLRTLNGKLIQHQLSLFYSQHEDQENVPIPSAVSYYHFMDESFHFNTSKIIGHEIPRSLDKPTPFELWAVNRGVAGCQKDHFHFSATVKGIFWYEPALFPVLSKLLQSPVFGMSPKEAHEMLKACFTKENDGIHGAHQLHQLAQNSYQSYVDSIDYLNAYNRDMALMGRSSIARYLKQNANILRRYE